MILFRKDPSGIRRRKSSAKHQSSQVDADLQIQLPFLLFKLGVKERERERERGGGAGGIEREGGRNGG